jgi:hypothetical protein
MAGAGRRTFTAGEVLTAAQVQDYLQDQAVMNFAGTAARASAIPSPSTGMVTHIGGGTVQVYNGTAWVALGGVPNAVLSNTATGSYTAGTPSVTYNYYTFTASGTATVTTAGFADVLAVGGGGAGGYNLFSSGRAEGGGGAGAVVIGTFYFSTGSFAVTIGAGAAGTTIQPQGRTGNASRVGLIFAPGGGGGGGHSASTNFAGLDGASGGGGANVIAGGSGISGVGNNGGAGNGGDLDGGGGGGAGAAGSQGTGGAGGAGGAGVANSYTGSSVTYGGGGGGRGGTSNGAGGAGGGGTRGVNGGANTGGGGGANATNGGSGIVIIRVAV